MVTKVNFSVKISLFYQVIKGMKKIEKFMFYMFSS